jgi:uncharacterized repeat protein (TIGR04138 family)
MNINDKLIKLAKDTGFDKQAFEFIHIALQHATGGERVHVDASVLLDSVKFIGHQAFGFLAKVVFNQWGIHTTDDWGKVVWALVESKTWGKEPGDEQYDFNGLWDFSVLEAEFEFKTDSSFPN